MAVETHTAGILVLILCASTWVHAQDEDDLCGFFTEIPKQEWPDDFPEAGDFEGMPWAERPLFPAPHRPDLCMGEYIADLNLQTIFMDEEIPEDVVIAQLNYRGEEPPIFFQFFTPRLTLEPRFERKPEHDNAWFIVVNGRQDYESLNPAWYIFEIRVPGTPMTVRVQLRIVNIDDNPPIIHLFDTCHVEELGEPRLTDCVYDVTDADGEISTRFMTFRIDSNRDDDRIFSIHYENVPGDWTRMTITLRINEPLDFVESAFHIFTITAMDSLPNSHTVSMMVEVENVPHRPPRWVEIWAVQQINEKEDRSFSVRAIDGDTGIDQPIYYKLNNVNNYEFFSMETLEGGRSGGLFHIEAIDRDYHEQEVFQLEIVAYKSNDETSYEVMPIVIIVNDINDQKPEPLQEVYNITIPEELPITLNFDEDFGFHDRDLGLNAQYNVHLESISPDGAVEAFNVAPQTGYQRQTFIMSTWNHAMLDYEIPEFQHIILRFVAIEELNPEHKGVAIIHIHLENRNDELPIFDEPIVEVLFDETVGAGFYVGTVVARDRDIDDWVTHSLLGNALNFLTIDELTGEVHVSVDDAFDYHRQNEIFVQVLATDNLMEPYHTAIAQLTIRLNDINNTPPQLRLPRRSPEVEENVPEGYVITSEGGDITATDSDTNAHLIFEIDWDTSYATKQGREAPAEEYHGCVEIETVYPDETTLRSAIGKLVVKTLPAREDVTIDFEQFEILYLTIRVVDQSTAIGVDYDELTLAIIIIDLNDNAPIWVDGTLETPFMVHETSASDFPIGSVLAIDIDGPLYNHIRYSIVPREDTPPNLVKIDSFTGQISVDEDEAIDADIPRRYFLYYTVVASDQCVEANPDDCPPDSTFWETEGNIKIQILDRNNRVPQSEFQQKTVYIYENAITGDEVVHINAVDLDRDEPHHTITCNINFAVSPSLRNFFDINTSTCMVYVNYTTDAVLDRDRGDPEHQIFFNIIDNFNSEGDRNRNQVDDVEVLVVLLDVNDNAPEMPSREGLQWSILENLEEGERLLPDIYARDYDEPDTDNSRVGYEILSLTAVDRDLTPPDLFIIFDIENITAELETAMPLRGFWGTYDIHILAFDYGDPPLSSNETYELVIRPFNFHAPQFVFPISGTSVRLARELASVNLPLTQVNGEPLNRIEATDEDGLDAGIVDFDIFGDDDAIEFFSVSFDGTLLITRLIEDDVREFQVTIRAEDRGTEPDSQSTLSTLTVIFVPTQGNPIFPIDTATVAVMEFEGGMDERHQLPHAVDNKNYGCTDDCHPVYYHIIGGNEEGFFALELETNILYLERMLDRSESERHEILVSGTNSATPPTAAPASLLTVIINVREADPRPRFVNQLYTAGLFPNYIINRLLFTVEATHTENMPIEYTIDWETMVIDDDSLQNVSRTAFRLESDTGNMFLNISPQPGMQGMFSFEIIASDGVEEDRAEVKVFMIVASNEVFFIFSNALEEVQYHRAFIAQTFTNGFEMICNIDDIVPNTDAAGNALELSTRIHTHFIRDNIPVPAEVIEERRSDEQLFNSIRGILWTEQLFLADFLTGTTPQQGDLVRIIMFVLAGLVGILAILFVALLIKYFISTRSLNRRLEALSTTKFGSVDSGLNRAGINAIGTNRYAMEGSNPMWNTPTPDLDAVSEESGGSDLIGVEELPQFSYSNPQPSSSRNMDNIDEGAGNDVVNPRIKHHNNNFGFNSTPFSPEFGNSRLNRYD